MKDIKHNQISLLFFISKKIKSSSINLHIKVVVFSGSLSQVLQYMGPYNAKEVYAHLDPQREILIIDIQFLWMFRDGVTYLSTSPIFNIVSALEQKGKIMFNPWSSFSKLLKLYVSLEALARVYKYLS